MSFIDILLSNSEAEIVICAVLYSVIFDFITTIMIRIYVSSYVTTVVSREISPILLSSVLASFPKVGILSHIILCENSISSALLRGLWLSF